MSDLKTKQQLRVRTMWVDALRSGDYEQGTGQLCNDREQYCCLGVYHDAVTDGYWKRNNSGAWGIADEWGLVNIGDVPYLDVIHGARPRLVSMNDADGCSFPQIADWIEEHL